MVEEVDAANIDVKSIVALLICVNAVRKDGVLLLGLEGGRLFKCLIEWLRHLIGE